MKANQAFETARMCRLLGVSTSGYYSWRKRGPSKRAIADASLIETISEIHAWSRGTYGAPMIHAELRDLGVRVGRKRVARLMRQAKIEGVTRRKAIFTTTRDSTARPAPDLIDRDFSTTGPDQLWLSDITYIPTAVGHIYLAVVLDAWSRRVIGWCIENHLRTELVLAALNMALEQRRPNTVIHHSDQGCQYTSIAFGKRCLEANVRPSMGSVGDCFDNAMCESFFATLECELIDRTRFESHATARREIFSFIEGWYNPHRRHSSLRYLSPVNFERRHSPTCHNVSDNLSTKAG